MSITSVLRTVRGVRGGTTLLVLVLGLGSLLALGSPLGAASGTPSVVPHGAPHVTLFPSATVAAPHITALAPGDQVEVVAASVNVRQAPTVASPVLTVEPQYRQGLALAGGVLANGYVWWEVAWDDNFTGWSAVGANGTTWVQNITGQTIPFDRAAALSYAATYWGVVTSDGYFWNGPSTYVSYPQGTSVIGLSGDDCAHFVSQVIGNEPHQAGGGLNIPSRVPPTYGEPGNAALGDMILNNAWGIQVNNVDQLEPGDVINYEWTSGAGWQHVADYVGHQSVAAHTNSHFGANWTLGGAYAYRFIHILATTSGGSGIDHPAVLLTLSPSSGSAPLTVTAAATVTGGSTTYTGYLFRWGDGTTTPTTTPTATHVYGTPGAYAATVEVTDSLGAVGWAANQTATVSGGNPPLVVTITASPLTGTVPLQVAFTASATGGSGTYGSYTWSFGDGSAPGSTSAPTAAHTYALTGAFAASVTVVDATSGANATSAPVTITATAGGSSLVVAITASTASGTAPLAVAFTATPSGGSGTYTSFLWAFGDGTSTTTSGPSASHTYVGAGTFTANVTVQDSSGSASTSPSLVLQVGSPTGGAPPLSVALSAPLLHATAPWTASITLAVSGGTAGYRVAWDYGDGTSTGLTAMSGSSTTVDHTFTSPGTFVVHATVEDASGQVATGTLTLQVDAAAAVPPSSHGAPSGGWGPLGSGLTGILVVAGLGGLGAALVAGLLVRRRHRLPRPPPEELPPETGSAPAWWTGPPGP